MTIYAYLGITAAAALEGEVVYVSALVLAFLGELDPLAVMVSGSVGGWAGDQFWFYAARGRLRAFLHRFEKISRRRQAIQARMHRHATKFILGLRFLPGLRIAIPLACAYANISPIRFSSLSFVSAIVWAGALMAVIQLLGPTSFGALGLKAWWAPVVPAALVLLFFRWLSKTDMKAD